MISSVLRQNVDSCFPGFLIFAAWILVAAPAAAQTLSLPVVPSRTGPGDGVGAPVLNSAQLAVDEANAQPGTPRFEINAYDDRSTDDGAREAARLEGLSTTVARLARRLGGL